MKLVFLKSFSNFFTAFAVFLMGTGAVSAASFLHVDGANLTAPLPRPPSIALRPDIMRERVCSDTDGGIQPHKFGTVTLRISQSSSPLIELNDTCQSATRLIEYSCFRDRMSPWNFLGSYTTTHIQCPHKTVCSRGACVQSP